LCEDFDAMTAEELKSLTRARTHSLKHTERLKGAEEDFKGFNKSVSYFLARK
jgi:hypothetical protein